MPIPLPRFAAAPLSERALADGLQDSCLVCDPYVYGRPRFLAEPLLVSRAFTDALYSASRRAGALFDELVALVWKHPELYEEFYRPTPFQRAMWLGSGGAWHTFARLDVFWCGDRFQVCEINADTPSGQSDIVACSRLLAGSIPRTWDPNADYARRLCEAIEETFRVNVAARAPETVGIIYPTDLPEDMALVQLYSDWMRERGCKVILGSPYNLERQPDGRVGLFGTPLDVVFRHYKTDWWGERVAGRSDEDPYLDPDPLEQTLWLLEAEQRGHVVVVNPFGAILAQDKRSMAFLWEHSELFSETGRESIAELIPETAMVRTLGAERLLAERERWVLKSDFGCEAEEVVIGRDTEPDHWRDDVCAVLGDRWVAQRAFVGTPLGERGVPNYGVYLIGGEPAGLYVRLAPQNEPTGHRAAVATPLIEDS